MTTSGYAMRPELQDIVDEAARLLGAPTTLEDREFHLIAFGTQRADVDPVRQASILQRRSSQQVRDWFEQFGIATSPVPVRTPADPASGIVSRLCLPARWRGVTYGYLWVLDETRALSDPAVVAAADLAEHAGAFLAQQSRQREQDAFALNDLLSGDADSVRDASTRLADSGLLRRGEPVVAVVAGVWTSSAPSAPLSLNLWQLPRAILASAATTSTTLLVPLASTGDLTPALDAAERTLALYRQRLPAELADSLVAGIGGARADATLARGSWQEAGLAARVAGAVESLRPVAWWDRLGVYRLLAADAQVDLAALVIDEPIRRLLDSPDTDLRDTLARYLELAGNAAQTAAALMIHRQTLYYRLAKAEHLTGLDLRSGHDRLRLHLGLTLAPLLAAPAPSSG